MAQLIEADWPAPAGVRAFTTTRPQDQFTSLAELTGARKAVLELQQVHGTGVISAGEWCPEVSADACISDVVDVACRVVTADCLPLLICNLQGTEIAAVHAGWRGLCAGIIETTLAAMKSPNSELMVWLGPAISQAHFEVGAEVREQFLDQAIGDTAATSDCFLPGAAEKYFADLYQLARIRLDQCGAGSVYGGAYCTYGAPEQFYSYRRDGASQRMQSIIYQL
ncbi:peptidoglycan editing factor PgeF [Halieaceae bacterium IMCC14734]|uniref:Purine nucleoside phosphorylase n=1 Tax=Candidatus Litorirhabdus singularis TaxID=2518993 RepID=A0ABT3TLJ3_9GAMM|nr:peptidoglycan editing factor PgeF [Candidatus Litorirhabdus singularis]MCX2983197.1 peptidoglycan editing factor PgeF [Candidatus Litorirhabdus singularis]